MSSLFSYSAITTKIRSMEGHLITDRDFREMASLKSVTEVAAFLKKFKPYENIFGKLDPEQLHRADLERLLISNKYGDFTRIYKFCNRKQRKCLNMYFLHYEVSLIKRCLRCCLNGKPVNLDLRGFEGFFRRHGKLNFEKITAATDIRSLIDALQGTLYYKLLDQVSKKENVQLFDYEVSLDLLYFKMIWAEKDKYLSKDENEMLTSCFGTRLDLLNLQWIYRSRKYYKLDSVSIYALLIPEYYRLKANDIKKLVEAENEADFESRLSETYYGKLEHKLFKEAPGLEELYSAILNKIYEVTAKKDPYSFAIINAYLHSKESEIQKIITVTESIRYQLPPDEIIQEILKQDTRRSVA